MFCWRITKYDPLLRDASGFFLGDEWTSYSDIGKTYKGVEFTYQEYCVVEKRYIAAIVSAMACVGTRGLCIKGLQKYPDTILQSPDLFLEGTYQRVEEDYFIESSEIKHIVQLILREYLWATLQSRTMYVHFGYDYYLYVGLSKACKNTLKTIENNGLFVEAYKSPYGKE